MVHALKPSIDRISIDIDRSIGAVQCGGSGRVGRVGSGRCGREPSAYAVVRHTRASGMEPGTLALVAVLAMAGVKVTIGGCLLAMGYVKCGGDANGGGRVWDSGRKRWRRGRGGARAIDRGRAEESASGKPKEA